MLGSLNRGLFMLKLLNAYSAEQQAIAIYQAEVFWRPGASGDVFRAVLAEEQAHPFNFFFGWLFGSGLSLLPRRLCYRIHVWAEREAAKTYEVTVANIGPDAPELLRKSLSHAAVQEVEHARRFEDLLAIK
jgi:rubrerythrin